MHSKSKDSNDNPSPDTIDKTMPEALCEKMKEAVPEIIETIRRREEGAAEIRFATSKSLQERRGRQET